MKDRTAPGLGSMSNPDGAPITHVENGDLMPLRAPLDDSARERPWTPLSAQATARYHSATPERGLIYHQRVMAAMSGQGFVPGPAPGVIPLPGPAMAGLCASGRGAVLLIGAQAPSLRPVVAVPNVELRLQGRAQQPARPRIMCLRTASRSAPG